MKLKEIEERIEMVAPLDLAMDFDHVGLLIGRPEKDVRHVLVALDLTEAVVAEAIEKSVDLIITHHPLFFEPVFSVTTRTARGRMILNLAEHGIAYYAAHTNMDIAKGGINDYLCDLLQLRDCAVLEPVSETDGLGRVGVLSESMPAEVFLKYVCKQFGCSRLRYTGNVGEIHKVAVCSGSGTSLAEQALQCGADALVTSDMKYSSAQQLEGRPLLMVDAGHYGTEVFFCDIIHEILGSVVTVETAVANQDYIKDLTC